MPLVVGITVGLVLAGGLGYWAFEHKGGQSSGVPVVIGNGITFSRAWNPVNASLGSVPGGPWKLTSVIGIAPEAPEFPVPTFGQYVGLNTTMAICGNLTGVTVWNSSSIPIFTGSLNSGGAPFWSFVLKNSSASFLYVTSILGVDRIYPSTVSTPCIVAAGGSGWGPLNQSITNDTPLIAGLAYSAGGENFSVRHSPLAEYYVLGGSQLIEPDASPLGWIVNYFRCDIVGVSGRQNYTAVGVLANGNQHATFIDNGWLNCTYSSYILDFGQPSAITTLFGSSGQYFIVPFQVVMPPSRTSPGYYYDGWGLQSWMTGLRLNGSGGTGLASTPASCQQWVTNVSECPSNGSGWFAVLLSQDGSWLDSYPSAHNATNWSIPNMLITSHDRLVIVLPSGWSTAGDTLAVASTVSQVGVSGSTPL